MGASSSKGMPCCFTFSDVEFSGFSGICQNTPLHVSSCFNHTASRQLTLQSHRFASAHASITPLRVSSHCQSHRFASAHASITPLRVSARCQSYRFASAHARRGCPAASTSRTSSSAGGQRNMRITALRVSSRSNRDQIVQRILRTNGFSGICQPHRFTPVHASPETSSAGSAASANHTASRQLTLQPRPDDSANSGNKRPPRQPTIYQSPAGSAESANHTASRQHSASRQLTLQQGSVECSEFSGTCQSQRLKSAHTSTEIRWFSKFCQQTTTMPAHDLT